MFIITIKDTLMWGNKIIINIKIQGVQGHDILNCPPENACFWGAWHLKFSSKIFANNFSDLLAIRWHFLFLRHQIDVGPDTYRKGSITGN